jgi:hypothetical protein
MYTMRKRAAFTIGIVDSFDRLAAERIAPLASQNPRLSSNLFRTQSHHDHSFELAVGR